MVVPPPLPPLTVAPSTAELSVEVQDHPRGWQIGEAVVLRKFDYSEENGHTKFLLHKVKMGVWYRVRGIDDDDHRVLVSSQIGYEFSFKIDTTVENNYIATLFPEGTLEPTADVLAFVNRKLPRLQISALEKS